MLELALLEMRVFPWRPRTRVMEADTLRDLVSGDMPLYADSVTGMVVGFAIWIGILVAAPLFVLVLAWLLFSVELPLLILLAMALVVARFAGLVPWTVVILDRVTGEERRETYRNLVRALRRVRDVSVDRRVAVRWAWA